MRSPWCVGVWLGLIACTSDPASEGRGNGGQAGASGESGASGASGESGASGASGTSGAAGASGMAQPPTMFHFEGTAAGSAAEDPADRVECRFYGDLLEPSYAANGDVSAVVIGEVFRETYVDDVKVSEFSALLGGDGTLTAMGAGAVEARLVGDQPSDAQPFWLALEVLRGQLVAPYSYQGEWACAPILLGEEGFTELDLTVPGSWQIEPAPAP